MREYDGPISEEVPPEPDEDSTENVIALLRKYEQELISADKIPGDSPEDYLLRGYGENHIESEVLEAEATTEAGRQELEDFTKLLRGTLNLVGIADPSSITEETVFGVDRELLEQLDPYNAESLFFEVAKRVRSRLGPYEPIAWKRLLEQAHPANRDVIDLDKLQLEQRMDAYSFLHGLNIDQRQLADMVKSSFEAGVASPSRRQNVNRAGYYLQSEPLLEELIEGLEARKEGETRAYRQAKAERKKRPKINWAKRERYLQPVRLEQVIRMGQTILRLRKERLEAQKSKQANLSFGNKNQWDSIDYEVYKKMMTRLKTSRAVGDLILAEMRVETVDELIEGFDTLEG